MFFKALRKDAPSLPGSSQRKRGSESSTRDGHFQGVSGSRGFLGTETPEEPTSGPSRERMKIRLIEASNHR